MSFYLHHVPGRLRVQIPQLQGRDTARVACRTVTTLDGVAEARVNATTGSLLIFYDAQRLNTSSLWDALCECGLVAGDLPIGDANGITRMTRTDAQSRSVQSEFLDAVAGIAAEKLLERVAIALIGALI
jgi:hypothetical protein